MTTMGALHGMNMRGQRVALVGCGGIGEPTAAICAELGAELVLADREAPQALAQRLQRDYGHSASAFALDVSHSAAIAAFLQQAGALDALVVTAGVLSEERAMEPGTPEWDSNFDFVYHINVRGPMLLAQLALRQMSARGGGRIVLVGSMAGRFGGLLSGAQYATSKGALHTLVRWLAGRGAPVGVSINGVAPGATDTDMIAGESIDLRRIPAGRLGQPIEVARVAAFLASPAASYVHGAVIDVNGGVAYS